MNAMSLSAQLTATQLGALALDAAMQIEDFQQGREDKLDNVRTLLNAVGETLNGNSRPDAGNAKLNLAFLPIYQSAVDLASVATPSKVDDFAAVVRNALNELLTGQQSKDERIIPRLRDFCIAVHRQSLIERANVSYKSDKSRRHGNSLSS